MSRAGYTQRFVRLRSDKDGEWFADPELRPRLVADAKEQNTNLTEIVLQILAKRVGYAYAPNGRKTEPGSKEEIINVSVPDELDALVTTTYPQINSPSTRMIRVLSAYYGLPVPIKKKQTRHRRKPAAA
jgi:hypothetical protein